MDLVRLTRPVDVLLFLAAALLGGWLAAGGGAFAEGTIARLVLAAVAAALVGVAGNVANDIHDVEIDRLNAPWRPLAAGTVSVRTAWLFWAALSLGGIVSAFAASAIHGGIAVAATVILWGYSAWLKRVPLVGHIVVGAIVAVGLAFGALAVKPAVEARLAVLAAIGLTFMLVTTREIVKAIPDIEGDRAHGVISLPVYLGRRSAALVAASLLAVTIAALPAFSSLGYDMLFVAYAIPLAALLLAAGWILVRTSAVVRTGPAAWNAAASRASRLMKVALAVGTVALALGRAGQ